MKFSALIAVLFALSLAACGKTETAAPAVAADAAVAASAPVAAEAASAPAVAAPVAAPAAK